MEGLTASHSMQSQNAKYEMHVSRMNVEQKGNSNSNAANEMNVDSVCDMTGHMHHRRIERPPPAPRIKAKRAQGRGDSPGGGK